ncbi:serine/threonine-protein phosphatase, partial [Actinomadura kijaniata]
PSPDPWADATPPPPAPPERTSPPREPDTVGPPLLDRHAAGGSRWAWLVGALGVTVVGLGAVTMAALENIRSGYYVGEENGKVVLYRGTTQEVPVISLSRKADAKDQPNPPILMADLPPVQQAAVKAKYEVKGPQAIRDLMNVVCRYTLTAENGKVTVVRGRGQDQCRTERIADSRLVLAELPLTDQTAIREGRLTFVGRQNAERALTTLTEHRDRCRGNPALQGCP